MKEVYGARAIGEKVPALKLKTSGLSIKVDGMNGPIADGELPKCIDFAKKIADQPKTSPARADCRIARA